MIEGIERRLRREFEIFSASSGPQALLLLEQKGEMQVIVSDMRMPGMSGAALLTETYKLYPDMVRVLLTGQADLESAIAAINEGQIFRFLLKPCSSDVLRLQLKAAQRQNELMTSERVLLEQTLRGAVHTLSEVLSQVGAVTLSSETASKLYRAQPLSADEQAKVDRLPAIALELLKPIPRLEAVRELISLAFGAPGANAPRALEAQVLRVCAEYDALCDSGLGSSDALLRLHGRGFDADLLSALTHQVSAEQSGSRVTEVTLHELRDGMVLAEDVYGVNGTLLLARGHSIKANVIERLKAMRANLGNRKTLRVTLPA